MNSSLPPPAHSGISDVERDTGLSKETLRVWERRYAFPQPLRDAHGERLYPAEQVFKLRLLKRLLDQGHRPGKIVCRSAPELAALAGEARAPAPADLPDDLAACLALCTSHQMGALRARLVGAAAGMGLERFVAELVAPLTGLIGEAWARGEVAVFEEHLYTEALQMALRHAIVALAPGPDAAGPRILLTTLPQERHALGLLMAEALFTAQGADCVSLGVQTPLADIVDATRSQRADIVALSFSAAVNPRLAAEGLRGLHAALPPTVALWAGGANAALRRRGPFPWRVLGLADIGPALRDWRGGAAPLPQSYRE
jgi:methylmalonyl-CoA mutase cobalamin-binding subunit